MAADVTGAVLNMFRRLSVMAADVTGCGSQYVPQISEYGR